MKKNLKINYILNLEIIIVIILLLILIFKEKLNFYVENFLIILLIFILIRMISKNNILSLILSVILFLFIFLINKYKNTIESFQNDKSEDNDKKEENDELEKSKENLKDLLKKVNGGIKLEDSDLEETKPLNIDLSKYKDDNKNNNALKLAQKETYELINTVNTLKDTITTLSPVLQEGKKLMDIFENIKI